MSKNDKKVINNRLINEKSPYLLQHAQNPVNWYPWGKEAFELARNENKPIFLSIGYSTCHWCHVMEKESFEDPEVAKLMNDTYVCIKVDREERPDLDKVYMAVCTMMTGSGGWPLTIMMTPDKKPFWTGTYIPKKGRFGRLGMLDLIPRINTLWQTQNDQLLNAANEMLAGLESATTELINKDGDDLEIPTLKLAYEQLIQRFDIMDGGFGTAPKFPTPHILRFLLRFRKRSGKENALDMVNTTLQAMRRGGIWDHVGFGFHRYATDSKWLVPHFEKMLYDQALLAMAYTEAYLVTKNPDYQQTAQDIFTYVLRDMTSPAGGFYSAEDADSEGEEGKFYVWTEDELRDILSPGDTELVFQVFNTDPEGNFKDEASQKRTGVNILHLTKSLQELTSELALPESDLHRRLDMIRQQLFEARKQRIHPYKDDKILTDWNGLMIAALAIGAQVFDEPKYLEAAESAVNFILTELYTPPGRLLHRYRDGDAAIIANLDDYAFLIWGLIELYETSFETKYLARALDLNQILLEHFWDPDDGAFYFTPDDGEPLLVRQKEIYDGAVPSGNSIEALNLLRLGRLTANSDLEDRAIRIGRIFSLMINQSPSSFTQMLVSVDFGVGPSYEVVIAGDSQADDTQKMIQTLRSQFLPNKVVLLNPIEQEEPDIFQFAEYLKHQPGRNGKATAYICHNYACQQPTTNVNEMLELLSVLKSIP